MLNNQYFNLFYTDGVAKQLNISVVGENTVISNNDLHDNNFELTERLMSDTQLRFGSCESSVLKFRVSNTFNPLKDKLLVVSAKVHFEKEPFLYGTYKVFSDTPTSDRQYRDIVAYDYMHEIINANVSDWYNSILPDNEAEVSLREFRSSFASFFGLEEEETALCNDEMIVKRTIDASDISGKMLLSSICEINGCFGHIGRNGKLQYVVLKKSYKAVYPEKEIYPENNLFPGGGGWAGLSEPTNRLGKAIYPGESVRPKENIYPLAEFIENKGSARYRKAKYEDYNANKITKLQIRKEENDIGVIVGDGTNCYIVQNNILVYGKSHEELQEIANNMFEKIKDVEYTPFECEVKGNPCVEVGDSVSVDVKGKRIDSYVLTRTLKGIQGLMDTFSANGKKEQSEKINSTQKAIIELRGKGNVLTRTVEETRSYIYDTEQRLSSEILQQAGEIALRVRKDQIISEINLTPEQITISAKKIDLVGIVNSDTFIANLINAEQLNAKFATVENLSAVNANFDNLNANNLKVGTVSTSRLDLDGILAGFASKTIQGIAIVGQTIRGSQFQVYDGSNYQSLFEQSVTIDGVNYRFLGRRV